MGGPGSGRKFGSLTKRKHPKPEPRCPHCSKLFHRLRYVQKHIREVHEKGQHPRFPCEICGRDFINKEGLSKHIDTKHNKRYEVACDTCGKVFMNRRILRSHVEQVHVGARIPCPVCHKMIYSKGALKVHLQTHEEYRPPPETCPTCNLVLKNKINLQRHINAVHLGIKKKYPKKKKKPKVITDEGGESVEGVEGQSTVQQKKKEKLKKTDEGGERVEGVEGQSIVQQKKKRKSKNTDESGVEGQVKKPRKSKKANSNGLEDGGQSSTKLTDDHQSLKGLQNLIEKINDHTLGGSMKKPRRSKKALLQSLEGLANLTGNFTSEGQQGQSSMNNSKQSKKADLMKNLEGDKSEGLQGQSSKQKPKRAKRVKLLQVDSENSSQVKMLENSRITNLPGDKVGQKIDQKVTDPTDQVYANIDKFLDSDNDEVEIIEDQEIISVLEPDYQEEEEEYLIQQALQNELDLDLNMDNETQGEQEEETKDDDNQVLAGQKVLLLIPTIVPVQKRFSCSDCSECYSNRQILVNHRASVHRFDVSYCSICSINVNNLRLHQYKAHKFPTPKCIRCDFRYSSEKELKEHTRSQHEKVICKICDAVLCNSENLNNVPIHMERVHNYKYSNENGSKESYLDDLHAMCIETPDKFTPESMDILQNLRDKLFCENAQSSEISSN